MAPFKKIIKANWLPFSLAIVLILLGFFPLVHSATLRVFNSFYTKKSNNIEAVMHADLQKSLSSVSDISKDPNVIQALDANDPALLALALKNKTDSGRMVLLVADRNGKVIYRSHTSQVADYIFQDTPWGRMVSQGKSLMAVEVGDPLPLVIIAGSPVLQSGAMIGGVFGGYPLDDAFAKDFKAKNLGPGDDIVFFSYDTGVTGKSIDDVRRGNIIDSYFNSGTDQWLDPKLSSMEVSFEGQDYFVRKILFDGIENSPGGALVFYKDNQFIYAALYAVFSMLVFLFIVWLIFHFSQRYAWDAGFRIRLFIYSVLVLVCVFFAVSAYLKSLSVKITEAPFTIYNSTLALSPESDTFQTGSDQAVSVLVSSGGESVNAFQISLGYDPRKIEVLSVDTSRSICDKAMFLQNNIDEADGRVDFACAIPNPGYSGRNGVLADLIVHPIVAGNFTLNFETSTQVLANDGLGTDVLRFSTDGSYLSYDDRKDSGRPIVYSPTHPNGTRWYDKHDAKFVWSAPAGAVSTYWLDGNPGSSAIPADAATNRNTFADFPLNQEGVKYFHLVVKAGGTRAAAYPYKIQSDFTPPETPDVRMSDQVIFAGELVRLEFRSRDALSGLQNAYYVKFDDGVFLPAFSPLYFTISDVGVHTVTIRVFDKAGNYSDTQRTVTVNPKTNQFSLLKSFLP